jgi:hypothetical protein
MFLRFITTERDDDSHQSQGVFQFAYQLLDEGTLLAEESRRLKSVLVWFERHLPKPDESQLDSRAIFWFKSDAGESTRRVWELAEFVRRYGLALEVVKTDRPGYLVYEDNVQVAAIPFRDTF